jgi:hypothetical protein
VYIVKYNGMTAEVDRDVRIIGDKIYLNFVHRGKLRDVLYGNLDGLAKRHQVAFEITMMQASIRLTQILILLLEDRLSEELLGELLPNAVRGVADKDL